MATRLVTRHKERRNGVAVSAASAKVASGAGVKDSTGDACSDAVSAKVAPRQSNRGRNIRADELGEEWETGVPEPANKLAASADRLNIIRAVNESVSCLNFSMAKVYRRANSGISLIGGRGHKP